MINRFSGASEILGALAVYASSFISGGCASPQSTIRTQVPDVRKPQITAPTPVPERRYNFETAFNYGQMDFSYTESVDGKSRTVDIEMYDTDGNNRNVEQAIVTRREGFNSKRFMFVREGAKIAEQPRSDEIVKTMTPEDQKLFDRLYGGDSHE